MICDIERCLFPRHDPGEFIYQAAPIKIVLTSSNILGPLECFYRASAFSLLSRHHAFVYELRSGQHCFSGSGSSVH